MALIDLEGTCPILWDHANSRRSMESEGWLDCFSAMGSLYLEFEKYEDAKIIDQVWLCG